MNNIEGQLFITFIGLLLNIWFAANVVIQKDALTARIGLIVTLILFVGYIGFRILISN